MVSSSNKTPGPASATRQVLRQRVARAWSKVLKLCRGKPSEVLPTAFLFFAAAEGSAGTTASRRQRDSHVPLHVVGPAGTQRCAHAPVRACDDRSAALSGPS